MRLLAAVLLFFCPSAIDLLREASVDMYNNIAASLSELYTGIDHAVHVPIRQESMIDEIRNGLALIPAAPFWLSDALPPQTWQVLDILLRMTQ